MVTGGAGRITGEVMGKVEQGVQGNKGCDERAASEYHSCDQGMEGLDNFPSWWALSGQHTRVAVLSSGKAQDLGKQPERERGREGERENEKETRESLRQVGNTDVYHAGR
jgi:hypothetical protein